MNVAYEFANAAAEKEQNLADLQKFQLSDGLNNKGGYLPRYIDDPYFTSMEAALRYQEWKNSISPNPDKPAEVMDFFINGFTYSKTKVKVRGMEMIFSNTSPWAAEIDRKTNYSWLGFNEETALEAFEYYIRPLLVKRIAARLGLKIVRV